ncbi:TPA: FKBP-type peptidyl-prolyl cis-trans isomerase [Acinetobacter baumannii]|uniref:FKBP-type peptidyl-prolyl cis-trans isomerase n=1 Tax=Acinetobacter baumannii TaxID=470 RepID=UPI00295976A8|nr:FKBP-type peptidyl-prolyl cis-trans isomerase [Acinetobacter baumannii]
MSKALPIAVAVVLGGAALVPVYYATQHPTTEVGRKADKNASPIQKISYVLGYEVAQQTPPELDTKAFVQGIHDARNKQPSAYTQEDLKAAVAAYEKELQQKMQHQDKPEQAGTATDSADAQFLAENKTKAGVKTTASGLQYIITKEGTGKQPTAQSIVKVHYEGRLINGQVFDSSYKRGQPVEFPLNQVIPGWTEGLQLMKEGGKATFFIPSNLAYGPQELPGIPANSALIFDVELISVK